MRIRRSLLFMPGDDRRKIEKGAVSGADCVIMDCEDGVAPNRKSDARSSIAAALREVDFGRTEKLVRVNAFHSGLTETDLAVTLPGQPDGYILPKVESPDDLRQIDRLIAAGERARGWAPNSIALLAIVETARGIVYLRELASCVESGVPRLQAIMLGSEDLTASLGGMRTAAGVEIAYARGALVLHARAYGLSAIDTVYLKLEDDDGLRADTMVARQMGYTGKLAVHPRQIAPIHEAFTPSTEEVAAARRLIDAFAAEQAQGHGTFSFDGRMVDMPVVHAAQRVIDLAKAAGIVSDEQG